MFGSCAGFLSLAIDSMRTRDRCLFTLHIAAVLIFSAYSLDICVTDNSGVRCGDGNHVRLTRIQGNEVGALSTYVLSHMFTSNSDVHNYTGLSGNLIENCTMTDK